jgi:SAM-dependent methyltransferase
MSAPKHPAKYSKGMVLLFAEILFRQGVPLGGNVLDPFAGTGRIHELRPHYTTFGIEIEPEWARLSPLTIVGDALNLPPNWTGMFDAVVTSPTYGNRMADSHEAKDSSRRMTYRHMLGRRLHPSNSGQLQWGNKYRAFHERAWQEAHRVLTDDGVLLLNISNHIRKGEEVDVAGWHREALETIGFALAEQHNVATPRMRFGANGGTRTKHEFVLVFRKNNPTSREDQ